MATAAEALRKLTGGQTLTDEEKKLLNISTAPSSSDITRSFYEGMGSTNPSSITEETKPRGIVGGESFGDIVTAPTGGSGSGAGGGTGTGTGIGTGTGTGTDTGTGIDDDEMKSRISAYDILRTEFAKYGLESLVTDARDLLINKTPASQMALALSNTKAYQTRFSANQDRIKAGLRALSPAEYISKEDAYQTIMRQYGLPASYYTKDTTGKQVGFEKLIAADVDDAELEDRVATAQKRVLNANPEVTSALKQFYPDITNGDILAYTLDPKNAIENIKRKVTAAEIGGAAMIPKNAAGQQILNTSEARATQLAGYGVDKAAATQGFGAIAGGLQRGSQLASMYGEDPYTQATAEEEVFKLSGQTEAEKQRKKITGLEKATFGGQSGISQGALTRDRAGGY
jgi:hypothetical protein